MRIDAREPGFYDRDGGRWTVYHAEERCFLRDVVWVDDETSEYGRFTLSGKGCITYKARRIEIHLARKIIVINPDEINKQLGITTDCIAKPSHVERAEETVL